MFHRMIFLRYQLQYILTVLLEGPAFSVLPVPPPVLESPLSLPPNVPVSPPVVIGSFEVVGVLLVLGTVGVFDELDELDELDDVEELVLVMIVFDPEVVESAMAVDEDVELTTTGTGMVVPLELVMATPAA